MATSAHRREQLRHRALHMRHAPTTAEARLFEALRGRRLGVSFRRQVVLAGRFIVDLYASEVRLVVEVDGGYHEERRENDAARDRALQRLGFHVVHLPNAAILTGLASAIELVQEAVVALRGG